MDGANDSPLYSWQKDIAWFFYFVDKLIITNIRSHFILLFMCPWCTTTLLQSIYHFTWNVFEIEFWKNLKNQWNLGTIQMLPLGWYAHLQKMQTNKSIKITILHWSVCLQKTFKLKEENNFDPKHATNVFDFTWNTSMQ